MVLFGAALVYCIKHFVGKKTHVVEVELDGVSTVNIDVLRLVMETMLAYVDLNSAV